MTGQPAFTQPRRAIVGAAFLLAAMLRPAIAQSSRRSAELTVTPAWLAAHRHDANLVVLQVGIMDGKTEFGRAHVPGARYIDMDDLALTSRQSADGLMLEMPSDDTLRAHLAALGVSDRSYVVVYSGDDDVSPATRVMLTLDHAGFGARSSLLDGGLSAWKKTGHATASGMPAPVAVGALAPLRMTPVVASLDYVRSHLGKPSFHLIDARAAAYYDGVSEGMRSGRKGHIPGARSVPFTTVTDDEHHFKSPEQLAALFATAGIGPRDTVVAYCHIGQQATAVLFAARLLGHPVLLYDGSFQEWGRHKELPVDDPSSTGTTR